MKVSLLQPGTPALTCQLPPSPRLSQESGWGHPLSQEAPGPCCQQPGLHPTSTLPSGTGSGCVPGKRSRQRHQQGSGNTMAPPQSCPQLMALSHSVASSSERCALGSVAPGQLEGQVVITMGDFAGRGCRRSSVHPWIQSPVSPAEGRYGIKDAWLL